MILTFPDGSPEVVYLETAGGDEWEDADGAATYIAAFERLADAGTKHDVTLAMLAAAAEELR